MTIRLAAILGLGALVQLPDLPPESGAIPVKVADLEGLTEGVVFDSAGDAYVSLLWRNAVYRIPRGGAPVRWLVITEPNGHKILPDGTHLLAARGGIYHIAPDGRLLDTIARGLGDDPLRSPNDLALDGHSGIYFTDPGSSEDDWRARRGRVYYLDSARRLHLAATDFCYPNGIIVRPDGRVLFVNDSCTSHVYTLDIEEPGRLKNRRIFASLPDSGAAAVDGMAFDQAGHLFVAHFRSGVVEVLDTTGELLRRYDAGMRLPTNLAFGGDRLDQLFVTGAPERPDGPGVLFILPLGVRGRSTRALPAPAMQR